MSSGSIFMVLFIFELEYELGNDLNHNKLSGAVPSSEKLSKN